MSAPIPRGIAPFCNLLFIALMEEALPNNPVTVALLSAQPERRATAPSKSFKIMTRLKGITISNLMES